MSSFHGDKFTTTVARLKQVCEDWEGSNDGSDKVNYDFSFTTEDGRDFWVYDWKEYRTIGDNEVIDFHIGADNPSHSRDALRYLGDLMEGLDYLTKVNMN